MFLHGLPDRPPLVMAGHQAEHIAGLHLALAIGAALVGRGTNQSGEPAEIKLTVQGSMMNIHQITFCLYTYQGELLERSGNHRRDFFPLGFFQAANGWVAIAAPTQAQWHALCQATDEPASIDDPLLATPALRYLHQDRI
jgi:crotonobetainyl-CoA:carnitine CoA-transferase CaiB-like acyl-CoA transferase